jgi:hypothetical protein
MAAFRLSTTAFFKIHVQLHSNLEQRLVQSPKMPHKKENVKKMVVVGWSQSHFTAGSQPVSQYVLVSSPLCGRLTRYCFLFKSMGLEFVVLSLWDALSDESQSHFTADNQSVSQYVESTGRLTRYCFLFKSLGLEIVALSLWGTLSDERPGLSFVSWVGVLNEFIMPYKHVLRKVVVMFCIFNKGV